MMHIRTTHSEDLQQLERHLPVEEGPCHATCLRGQYVDDDGVEQPWQKRQNGPQVLLARELP